jgi:hypothetical protein
MTRKQVRGTIVRFELMSVPGVCWTITDYVTGECKSYKSYEEARTILRELRKSN